MSGYPTEVVIQESPFQSPLSADGRGFGTGVIDKRPSIPSSIHGDALERRYTQAVPQWIYYLMLTVLGMAILGGPALYISITSETDQYWPVYITTRFVPYLAETFRWSLLAASTYGAYFMTLTLITMVPSIINFVDYVSGRAVLSKREEEGLLRVVRIKRYFAQTVASLTLWLMAGVLIGSVPSEANMVGSSRASEFYVTRTAFAMFVFLALLLVEKMLMQKIAVNYHYEYYADRIGENQFNLAALRRLCRKFPPSHSVDDVSIAQQAPEDHVRKEAAALALASFEGLQREGRDYLVPSDLEGVLGPEGARHFFDSMDIDGNGDLTLEEMIASIQGVYAERDLLNQAIVTNDELVDRLDGVGMVMVLIISAALCLPIFNVSVATSLFSLASTIMAARVAFTGSIVSIFSTIIFIFVSHPFDVGDAVFINGQKFKVKSIGWWNSSFYGDGQRLVYMANDILEGAIIGNIRRSGPQEEEVLLLVHVKTTTEQLGMLRERVTDFVLKNPRDYLDGVRVSAVEIINNVTLKIKISVTHKSNFQKSDVKNRRSSELFNCIRTSFEQIDIKLADDTN